MDACRFFAACGFLNERHWAMLVIGGFWMARGTLILEMNALFARIDLQACRNTVGRKIVAMIGSKRSRLQWGCAETQLQQRRMHR